MCLRIGAVATPRLINTGTPSTFGQPLLSAAEKLSASSMAQRTSRLAVFAPPLVALLWRAVALSSPRLNGDCEATEGLAVLAALEVVACDSDGAVALRRSDIATALVAIMQGPPLPLAGDVSSAAAGTVVSNALSGTVRSAAAALLARLIAAPAAGCDSFSSRARLGEGVSIFGATTRRMKFAESAERYRLSEGIYLFISLDCMTVYFNIFNAKIYYL